MKTPRPLVIEREGKVVGIFASTSCAARCIGVTDKAVNLRITNGMKRNNDIYRYATKEEAAIIRSILPAYPNENTPPLVEELRKARKPREKKPKKATEPVEDKTELDGEKYTLVSYEMTAERICITPCPYREAPKPKVGSAACMRCGSFHGRNRTTLQVACGALSWKPWMRTKEQQINEKEKQP